MGGGHDGESPKSQIRKKSIFTSYFELTRVDVACQLATLLLVFQTFYIKLAVVQRRFSLKVKFRLTSLSFHFRPQTLSQHVLISRHQPLLKVTRNYHECSANITERHPVSVKGYHSLGSHRTNTLAFPPPKDTAYANSP